MQMRKVNRITQSYMAGRMNISPTYLSDLEHGRKKWTLKLWGGFINALTK